MGERFGRRRRSGGWALRDCSFRLPAGRVCAVVGPNGAGKSTLLALAAGLLAPTEGTVTVLGTDPASTRTRVGFVAQDKPLYPHLTVAETLRTGADLNPDRWDAPTAERIVAADGLGPKTKIRALSGGQGTRVALALALAKRFLGLALGALARLVLRRSLPAPAVAVVVTEAVLATTGYLRNPHASSPSWPLRLVETGLVLAVAAAAAVIAFRLLRRCTV